MRTQLFAAVLVATVMLAVSIRPTPAQEKTKEKAGVTQEKGKLGQTTIVTRLLENERVGVVRMVSKAGDKGAMRERLDRVLYIVEGAKVRFRYPDGKTEDAAWKAGDVVYQKADNRQVENIDAKDLVT